MKPKFITLEGVDGAGKSTHIQFIKKYFIEKDLNYVFTREPGGTILGEKLREILLYNQMEPETESLLMFAARNEHVHEIIEPNLNKGINVISDRFTDATYAYQSGGKNVEIDKITVLKDWVHKNLQPDLTFLFDLPVEISISRLKTNGNLDKFENEGLSFHKKIRNSYLNLAKKEPNRFKVIDSSQNINKVQDEINLILDKVFL
ncbi:dTMP kinase [Nitrosomonadales bacterium]|nr:dTMP kinase [Nitrosomonadales bacterium]